MSVFSQGKRYSTELSTPQQQEICSKLEVKPVRIPFPERVPIDRVALFAVALFMVQWLEGTALYFRFGCAVFILVAAFAFNTAGGLTRASGAYVFFYSVLVVIIGVCYKAFLGEPGQSNLLDPRTTIEVYVGGITAMLAAVIVSSRFRRKSGLLQNLLTESQMYRSSVGCIVFGATGGILVGMLGQALGSAFTQLNQLIPLGIIIGVMYEVRRSGGTRSLNLPMLLAGIYCFLFYGVIGFSKQGMLLPMVCWFFPVCALRFRLSALQVFSGLVAVFIVFYYLVPFAQYGRSQIEESQSVGDRAALAVTLLEHPNQTKRSYEEVQTSGGGLGDYYNTPQGFWDRLQFVSIDDALINLTDTQDKTVGLAPIRAEFINAIPHIFWPGKPEFNFGNFYAHELGELAPDDTATGISFSPTSEAYHMEKWVGVLVVAPLLWFLLFVVFDSLFGDLRTTPWGLLVIAMFSHSAPEGALTGAIYLLTFGTEALVFCAFFATWIAPIFAIPILGPNRSRGAAPMTLQPTKQIP
jgi:hypothetical protein